MRWGRRVDGVDLTGLCERREVVWTLADYLEAAQSGFEKL